MCSVWVVTDLLFQILPHFLSAWNWCHSTTMLVASTMDLPSPTSPCLSIQGSFFLFLNFYLIIYIWECRSRLYMLKKMMCMYENDYMPTRGHIVEFTGWWCDSGILGPTSFSFFWWDMIYLLYFRVVILSNKGVAHIISTNRLSTWSRLKLCNLKFWHLSIVRYKFSVWLYYSYLYIYIFQVLVVSHKYLIVIESLKQRKKRKRKKRSMSYFQDFLFWKWIQFIFGLLISFITTH